MSALLEIESLTVRRGTRMVVEDAAMQVDPGEVVGLIGPNGAGKTSLMRAALGLLPHKGRSSLARMSPSARARAAAWMPQMREIAWPVSVETVVALGRLPHLPPGTRMREEDAAAVARALERMDLVDFALRPATELSGGEQARVLIARALAQEAPLLVADEPVAGLDPAHQIATMDAFGRLARGGQGVLVSLHDLGLAARHCSRLVLLDRGRIVADAAPDAVLTETHLREVFGVRGVFTETALGRSFQALERVE